MKMSDGELTAYIDMWLAIKTYVTVKDRDIACEKFLAVINESLVDLSEVGDEWFGYDSTLDRVIRDSYFSDGFDEIDEDSDEADDWQ